VRTAVVAAALAALMGLGAADALAQRGPAQMQERFERMEQMMERMPQAGTRAERRQIMREHHQEMRAQMEELRGMRGPGPQADPEERLRFMEQRHETMQEMMRQMLRQQERLLEDE
jgi:predicted lipoprotein